MAASDETMNNTSDHEEKLLNEINTLKHKLGTYQQISDDPKDIACSACPSQKLEYEICMQKWYNNTFLKGKAGTTLPCQPEYDVYNKCVLVCLYFYKSLGSISDYFRFCVQKHLKSKDLEHLLSFEFKE